MSCFLKEWFGGSGEKTLKVFLVFGCDMEVTQATFVSHLATMRQKIADSLESKLSGKLTGLTKKR